MNGDAIPTEAASQQTRASAGKPIVVGVFFAALAAAYTFLGLEPNPLSLLALKFVPAVAATTWMAADARQSRIGFVYDRAWFFFLTFPVSIPWYALRTRGRRGWPLVLALYALALAGQIGSVIGELFRHLFRAG